MLSKAIEDVCSFSGYSTTVLQERLERQQHENEVERARLQGLITRLEMQLTNQARELEEVNALFPVKLGLEAWPWSWSQFLHLA